MTIEASNETIEGLATRWLAAELRAAGRPKETLLSATATTLGLAYDDALRAASPEELLVAWERAREAQAALEVGSREWAEARRVSELLRTEYAARVGS